MCCIMYKCYLNRVKLLFWLPVIAEWLVVGWTYYVYVLVMCLLLSKSFVEQLLLLSFYHIFVGLALWCQLKAIYSTAMVPSREFNYDEEAWQKLCQESIWIQRREETEKLRLNLGIRTAQTSMGRGLIVYCIHCKLIKPDRCHHCSHCGICVLKMDHHCPWVNNCVGFHNYKFFLLFIIYTFVSSVFISATSMRFVIAYIIDLSRGVSVSDHSYKIQITFMCGALILLSITLLPLLKLHGTLVLSNITTLENTRPVEAVGKTPDHRIFDLGWRENLLQTFGRRKLLWLLPVFSSLGDGAHFTLREDNVLTGSVDARQSDSLEEVIN